MNEILLKSPKELREIEKILMKVYRVLRLSLRRPLTAAVISNMDQ